MASFVFAMNVSLDGYVTQEHQISSGIFAEDDWTIGKLVLTGGIRADRWSIRNGFYKAESAAGVVTHSSGNHGQGTAAAALGIGLGVGFKRPPGMSPKQ